MELTLDQALTILGRLEDDHGFDTPRERFRRFLRVQVTTLDAARDFIQQCRETSGEQSHRALHDAIVLTGTFLGFDVHFGRYRHDPGTVPDHGSWLSRRRLEVRLVVCSDLTGDLDLDLLSRSIGPAETGAPRIGLLVTTSFYPGRARLEGALSAMTYGNLRVVSLDGLLRLCAMVADRQLSHEDVLQLLNPAPRLDVQLDLLDRITTRGPTAQPVRTIGAVPTGARDDRRYWVNVVRAEPFTGSDRIVTSVLATRRILGINPAPGSEDRVRPGDRVCVFVDGRGIVAHAEVAGVLADGSEIMRDSSRFRHVLRLTTVTVFPVPVRPSQQLAAKIALALASDAPNITTPISPHEFDSVASPAFSQAG